MQQKRCSKYRVARAYKKQELIRLELIRLCKCVSVIKPTLNFHLILGSFAVRKCYGKRKSA